MNKLILALVINEPFNCRIIEQRDSKNYILSTIIDLEFQGRFRGVEIGEAIEERKWITVGDLEDGDIALEKDGLKAIVKRQDKIYRLGHFDIEINPNPEFEVQLIGREANG